MTPNGDASARMEQEIMEKLMFGPSMTVEKLAKPARKVVFETGLEDDEAMPENATEQTGGVVEKEKLVRKVVKYETGKLTEAVKSGKVIAEARVTKHQEFLKKIVKNSVQDQDRIQKRAEDSAKDWELFQKAIKDIAARKACKVVYHDATEVPEPEWEEIDEEEAIDNFVEIGEMDAIEKYVVVDLTAAKNLNVRKK